MEVQLSDLWKAIQNKQTYFVLIAMFFASMLLLAIQSIIAIMTALQNLDTLVLPDHDVVYPFAGLHLLENNSEYSKKGSLKEFRENFSGTNILKSSFMLWRGSAIILALMKWQWKGI